MFRFLWVVMLVSITLLGVWLASSLVAFAGGPPALAVVGGVVLFPILPLWWEKRATDAFHENLRRARRLLPKKRALTAPTRIALRTVFLNLVFVAVLLVASPKIAFAALATNGDWFLGDEHGPWSDRTRAVLVASSSGLEWLHKAANDNPYRTKEDEQQPVPEDVKPLEVTTRFGSGARWRKSDPTEPQPIVKPDEPQLPTDPGLIEKPDEPPTKPPEPTPTEEPEDLGPWNVGETHWPWKEAPSAVVTGMTASDETSLEGVARYIAARTTDPFERVKALHDWAVTRLRYDHDSVTGKRKPQDAQTVFLNRMGVCEGYARLMVAFGKVTGDRIVYVTGDVREDTGELMPVGHAWNAVEIKGAWYLMDVTWDDPTSAGEPNRDLYQTDYLFIPPQFMGLNHQPDDQRWQLRQVPLSRAEFLRQPLGTPALAKERLTLISPARPIVDVSDSFELKLENPARAYVMLQIGDEQCGPVNDAELSLRCEVPSGVKEANVFVGHQLVGQFDGLLTFKLR
ncbi:MAG: transglutaminase domain-containing protein [Archangium sp.]